MANIKAIVREYKASESIKEVARKSGLSFGKVRKILITEGAVRYERTDELTKLMQQGLSIEQAAERLGISTKLANNYIPYSKGEYRSDSPTLNALRIRKCLERKKKEQ
ncbi:hypothetical protein SELR_pSRC401000 (plasmid) [Selenomonas ruminantium subsp. lactilytica TAM6421]|uniref:Uncharacterized protein n=1 Tax=Selenomonas ruminantium subsp. lactilytica (strain NBRC 103574 / TAM6421) TaxID=927704 RepID=I0GVG4_SELRL|nr:hypothetical protein [Selenomonas ruminantium]BAL84751.1 hypothetical protein SELR_pSRC401000 [Selenomonas ruminantium subsp. lactilytica TAM6421]